ncbi:MAG TPA: hypothetical protein VII71_05020, partial [Verrucomicrobiae bacterium]
MKRPLGVVVACYATGILLADVFQPPLAVLFAATFVALALALFLKRSRPWLLAPLLALVGWTNLAFHTAIISPNDLRPL